MAEVYVTTTAGDGGWLGLGLAEDAKTEALAAADSEFNREVRGLHIAYVPASASAMRLGCNEYIMFWGNSLRP